MSYLLFCINKHRETDSISFCIIRNVCSIWNVLMPSCWGSSASNANSWEWADMVMEDVHGSDEETSKCIRQEISYGCKWTTYGVYIYSKKDKITYCSNEFPIIFRSQKVNPSADDIRIWVKQIIYSANKLNQHYLPHCNRILAHVLGCNIARVATANTHHHQPSFPTDHPAYWEW